jgi:hypothetical protein
VPVHHSFSTTLTYEGFDNGHQNQTITDGLQIQKPRRGYRGVSKPAAKNRLFDDSTSRREARA